MRTEVKEKSMDAYWAERARSYSGMNRAQLYSDRKAAWEAVIFSHVDESCPLKVLDIGTGPGFFAILAALRGHTVTAVDMNGKMLCHAQENAAAAGADIGFMQVGHILPFTKESFDLILSRDVTWTVTEPEKQLESWAQLLRPDGKMLYFDAEWYFHLKNKESYDKWQKIKKRIEKAGIVFYPKGGELEEIAADLPNDL